MRWRLLQAAMCGVVILGVAAGPTSAAGWADALFSERVHDFGPVARGAKVRHDFLLVNRLPEPISIVDIRASCGCTSGRASASTVPPGQAAKVEAEMDTRNFVGPKATALFVTLMTASGREAEVHLGVSATILSDVVLNPGTIDFGAVARGQAPTQTLTIDRVGMPDWRAERMVSTSRALNATLVETARKGSSVSYLLTVALKPEAPAGPIRDEIRILTNDPETASIPVQVSALVRGELSASPSVLSLGRVASAGGVQGRFLVRGIRPFTITQVEGAGDGFKLAPDDNSPKPVHLLSLTYRPEEGTPRGDLRRLFRVHTDLPAEPPVEVSVSLHVDP
ncbi:MAG: DUF1573 domain-containing protein [Planctomycetaceae bacterium]|nr:DUF1573 domain-containing protein [Planctomycetaceae bacterium]